MIKTRAVSALVIGLWSLQFAVMTSSCSLMSAYREVTLQFPEVPEKWLGFFDGISWELEAPGVLPEPVKVILAANNGCIRLPLPKDRPVPLLGYPVFQNRERGKPAGAVHPFQTEAGGRIVLSWTDGYGAQIVGILKLNGNLFVDSFNIPRLLQTLPERSDGNPWNINTDVLLSALTWGGFREDRIRVLPAYNLTLSSGFAGSDGRPSGIWVSDNPLAAPAAGGKMGAVCFPELREGVQRFFHTGTGERLVIGLGEDGYTAMLIDGEKTETGTW